MPPYYSRRRYTPYSRTYRNYARRLYSVRGTSTRAWRRSGYPTGTRASYRKVRGYRRAPWGLIRNTYTVPEKKFSDIGSLLPVTGNVILLNGLEQGTGYDQRIGRNVMLRSVHLKFQVNGAPYNAGTPSFSPGCLVRVLLVWDQQPNGTLPSIGEIFQSTTPGLLPLQGMNMANSQRFKFLFDRRYVLSNADENNRAGWKWECFDETFQKLNLKVGYSDTSTGTISDIETGALYWVQVTDIIDPDNLPEIALNSRIRYFDN